MRAPRMIPATSFLGGRRGVRQRQEGVAGDLLGPAQRHTVPRHLRQSVFAAIDAERFQQIFIEWVRDVYELTKGQAAAIDGKTLRRSHDKRSGKSAIHMVGARASANGVVLGQTKVDDKSNEITAMPELLDTLDVAGCAGR